MTKSNDSIAPARFETLTLTFDRRGVASVELTRAEALNTFDAKTVDELMWAFALLSADRRVRVIVLATGGRLLQSCVAEGERRPSADATQLAALMDVVGDCAKPVVSRLQGAIYGAALALCCVSDIVLATPDSRFAIGDSRLGLAASAIVPYLHSAIGRREAQRLALTGEVIDATRAVRLQIVSEVVADSGMGDAVQRLTMLLLASEPRALDDTKAMFRQLANLPAPAIRVDLDDDTDDRRKGQQIKPQATVLAERRRLRLHG